MHGLVDALKAKVLMIVENRPRHVIAGQLVTGWSLTCRGTQNPNGKSLLVQLYLNDPPKYMVFPWQRGSEYGYQVATLAVDEFFSNCDVNSLSVLECCPLFDTTRNVVPYENPQTITEFVDRAIDVIVSNSDEIESVVCGLQRLGSGMWVRCKATRDPDGIVKCNVGYYNNYTMTVEWSFENISRDDALAKMLQPTMFNGTVPQFVSYSAKSRVIWSYLDDVLLPALFFRDFWSVALEELMQRTWHPVRHIDWCLADDEKP